MTDLKNGKIQLGGGELSPSVTRSRVEKEFGLRCAHKIVGNYDPKTNKSDLTYYVYESEGENIEGVEFSVRATFANEKLYHVTLVPSIPEIDSKYDLRGYAIERWIPYKKEIRKELDKWLKKQLGKPSTKDNDETTYIFKDVTISTASKVVSDYDGRAEVVGGQVDIHYESVMGIDFFSGDEAEVK